jgi:BirA family transcriptional regulator, biotin operon repressor / biotin---[acetyl-CoA-carboxylase] ligase
MIQTPFITRRQHFAAVGSTNDVVRDWLAEGTPEVCLAVADEQTAGRGRGGRTWTAPPGRALLLSLGFRPTKLAPERVWRLAAVTSLAMADAAEEVGALAPGTIRLKWPNDLVVEIDGEVRKLAGVLGETDGLGTDDPRAVVGIGINADWPAYEFPPELADSMTSLQAISAKSRIDGWTLLDAFTASLEAMITQLRQDGFDGTAWADRQLTNGRLVRLTGQDGREEVVSALGVDPETGALNVADEHDPAGQRAVMTGEIHHLRLDDSTSRV